MKTYKQFMSEAVPALLAAPAIMKAAPLVVGAGVKAAQSLMKATKQGQGGRSQPTDYGQGGTAKPRTKNVQRPTGKQPKASYKDRLRAQQKADRLERQQSSGSSQIGPSAAKEAEKAAEARAKNDPRTSRLRGTIADRMARGAKQNKLGEGQVGIDRVIGARIRDADKNINKKYKDITNPKDPNTAENLLRGV